MSILKMLGIAKSLDARTTLEQKKAYLTADLMDKVTTVQVPRFARKYQDNVIRLRSKLNQTGSLDAGEWATLFVSVVVLVLIIAALFPILTSALASYGENETTFGPILVVIVPLVIGAALLLGIVAVFLAKSRGGM